MSDKNKEQTRKMPHFTRLTVRKWIQTTLGMGMKPSEAAARFLRRFPDYNSEEFGDYEKRLDIVKQRFYHYNSDSRTTNYHEIKRIRESGKKDLHEVSLLANPVERLCWLENLLFSGAEFTVSQELKILAEIGKIADQITGADTKRAVSSYGGTSASPTQENYGMIEDKA